MIEDLFFKRHPERLLHGGKVPGNAQRVLSQVAQIFAGDIMEPLALDEEFFVTVQRGFQRELGVDPFPRGRTALDSCGQFLNEVYDLWNDRHGDADLFLKVRLSFIELLFRSVERLVESRGDGLEDLPAEVARTIRLSRVMQAVHQGKPTEATVRERKAVAVKAAVDEMNARFRAASFPFRYHNGVIQLATDEQTEERIAAPFWSITRDPKWGNVDQDMKRAVELADTGGPDPALYATMALESTIKIISGEKGWTTGSEKGAANYIDNLVSQKNGRFIDPWEAEMLKAIFARIRNPHGHGPGSAPPPVLNPQQTAWVVETCTSWIKSLIQRL